MPPIDLKYMYSLIAVTLLRIFLLLKLPVSQLFYRPSFPMVHSTLTYSNSSVEYFKLLTQLAVDFFGKKVLIAGRKSFGSFTLFNLLYFIFSC